MMRHNLVENKKVLEVDIHSLFVEFSSKYFNGTLHRSSCLVEWSNRMTSCAGLCIRNSDTSIVIRLSRPLLKYRSIKELHETLLHEMIHSYNFLMKIETFDDYKTGGHGNGFLLKMHEINQKGGFNITVYHSFNDEVNSYKNHVWRCNGSCRDKAPYYGYVRRAMNKAPSNNDRWFPRHECDCGGKFIKISEPEKCKKRKNNRRSKSADTAGDFKSNGRGIQSTLEGFLKGKESLNVTGEKEESKGLNNTHSAFIGTGTQVGGGGESKLLKNKGEHGNKEGIKISDMPSGGITLEGTLSRQNSKLLLPRIPSNDTGKHIIHKAKEERKILEICNDSNKSKENQMIAQLFKNPPVSNSQIPIPEPNFNQQNEGASAENCLIEELGEEKIDMKTMIIQRETELKNRQNVQSYDHLGIFKSRYKRIEKDFNAEDTHISKKFHNN